MKKQPLTFIISIKTLKYAVFQAFILNDLDLHNELGTCQLTFKFGRNYYTKTVRIYNNVKARVRRCSIFSLYHGVAFCVCPTLKHPIKLPRHFQ